MLTQSEKQQALSRALDITTSKYADSIRVDIAFVLEGYKMDEEFYDRFDTPESIESWVDFVVSQAILKYDGEESFSDFVDHYLPR